VLEFEDVAELPIDRGEPDVGDLIQGLQAFHDELADLGGLHFFFGALLEPAFDLLDDLLEPGNGDRPLFDGLEEPAEELLAVEELARAVLLNDHVRDLFDLLVRRKPAGTTEAFPAAADRKPFLALARVDDLALRVGAKRTFHGVIVSPRRLSFKRLSPSFHNIT